MPATSERPSYVDKRRHHTWGYQQILVHWWHSPARWSLPQSSCPQRRQREPTPCEYLRHSPASRREAYTSPLTSNQTSRWALPSTTGQTAIKRIMRVFPSSIEMYHLLNGHSKCPDLRIHHIWCHIGVGDMLSKLASKLCLDLLEL